MISLFGFRSFWWYYQRSSVVVFHCIYNLDFPNDQWTLNIFTCDYESDCCGLILMRSNSLNFFIIVSAFCVICKKSLPNLGQLNFFPVLSFRSFEVLALNFRSVIHFHLNFVCSVR